MTKHLRTSGKLWRSLVLYNLSRCFVKGKQYICWIVLYFSCDGLTDEGKNSFIESLKGLNFSQDFQF